MTGLSWERAVTSAFSVCPKAVGPHAHSLHFSLWEGGNDTTTHSAGLGQRPRVTQDWEQPSWREHL